MAEVGGNTTNSSGTVDAGFAKLQGQDFEYYMQSYSIILGRNSKKATVDVDLSNLGGGVNISRKHARIFYDFEKQQFALDVIGKNGCYVQGVLRLPGSPPIQLHSQDLLQFGNLQFYFLLPMRSIFASAAARGNYSDPIHPVSVLNNQVQLLDSGDRKQTKEVSKSLQEIDGNYAVSTQLTEKLESSGLSDSLDKAADLRLLLHLEEKDVVDSITAVLNDLYKPGEWITIEKLHAKT
ncbi:FHA domain-containing protein FHA2-like isoform X2 [Asparagus officinalis]|uniref:FHA domain-containing protein FHA2-like isoform X2 n=1 Tax=Asparagus officinalis TaxID=4686 RepID=UPI00098E61C5|nr:FHA domain-containing protein FHA2-like isoform X2 [Asparagus officinalis]